MTRQLNDYFHKQEEICRANDAIAPRLYDEYGVNKGLRDENGKGVLTGLTNISNIVSSKVIDGKKPLATASSGTGDTGWKHL